MLVTLFPVSFTYSQTTDFILGQKDWTELEAWIHYF